MILNNNQVLRIDHKIYVNIKGNLSIYHNGIRTFNFNSNLRQYLITNVWWVLKRTIWDTLIAHLQ